MERTRGQTLRSGYPDEDEMLATMTRVLQFLPMVMRFGTGPIRPGTLHTYPARSWGLTHSSTALLAFRSPIPGRLVWRRLRGGSRRYFWHLGLIVLSPHLIRAIGGHSSETGEVLHYCCDGLTMYVSTKRT
jgi:hypothetical protein